MADIVGYCVGGTRTWTAPVGNVNQYVCVPGELISGAHQDDAEQEQSRAGQISWLRARVRVIESGKIGETSKVTLMKNGQSTGLVVQVTGAYPANDHQLFESSATVVVTFAADDRLYWKIEPKSDIAGRVFRLRSISLRIQ